MALLPICYEYIRLATFQNSISWKNIPAILLYIWFRREQGPFERKVPREQACNLLVRFKCSLNDFVEWVNKCVIHRTFFLELTPRPTCNCIPIKLSIKINYAHEQHDDYVALHTSP